MISWFGGKNRMSSFIYEYIPKDIKNYIEPFSGAMWVYFNEDFSMCDNIVFNDINKFQVNLFKCCQDNEKMLKYFDKYLSEGGDLYHSLDEDKTNITEYKEFFKKKYYEWRNSDFLDNEDFNVPDYDVAIKYAFLITSAFNACYPKAAGCSAFNKDRLKMNALINKMKKEPIINKLKNITHFENRDFESLITEWDAKEGSFFYLDPPYEDVKNNRLKWYGVNDESTFGRASHERLSELLKNSNSRWALSYYYFEELEEWFPKDKYRWVEKDFFRSSASFSKNKDTKGSELLIMNY